MEKKRRIVLVHGASHGAWCWEQVIPRLESQGFTVDAPDLPGLGQDNTAADLVTFQAYVDRIRGVMLSRDEPVTLVGHSMGGWPISQAAELLPHRVHRLIYLAAVVPQSGESLNSILQTMPLFGQRSARDYMRPSADGLFVEFSEAAACEAFYNCTERSTALLAARRLRPQSVAPLLTAVQLTPERWGAIPKTYIVCARDNTLPSATQRWFCFRIGGVTMCEIDSDHSPFYSAPVTLAEIIEREC
jgi:pimeloyl-ACP methyl ester carboxylesterase